MRSKAHALCSLAFCIAAAHAGIVNPSFELPVLSPGGFQNGSIPGWSGPTAQSFYFGITSESAALPPVPDGHQVAFVNNFGTQSGTPTSHAIAQQLTDTLEPNVAYVFSASFGWRNDNDQSTGRLELWCGGTVSQGVVTGGTLLASKNVTLLKGQFVRDTIKYLSLPPWDHLGETISVRLVGTPVANGFAQTNFDAAQLLTERLTPCQADLNSDKLVDDLDFSVFIIQYDALECNPAPLACTADLNFDGLVDDADFSLFIAPYDALLCPEFVPSMRPVSQARTLSAQLGAQSQSLSAPDFNPFGQQITLQDPSRNHAIAVQSSSMDEFTVSVHEAVQTIGPDTVAEASFIYLFDLDYQAPYALTSDKGVWADALVEGLFIGPSISLDLTLPGPFGGTILPGRYTLRLRCLSAGPYDFGHIDANFKLNQLP